MAKQNEYYNVLSARAFSFVCAAIMALYISTGNAQYIIASGIAFATVLFLVISFIKQRVKLLSHAIFILALLLSANLAWNELPFGVAFIPLIFIMLFAGMSYSDYLPFLYAGVAGAFSIIGYSIRQNHMEEGTFFSFCGFAILYFFAFIIKLYIAKQERNNSRGMEDLYFSAYHDPLTGLPNRLLFYDRLQQAILNSNRTGKPLAVLFLDLDSFKRINDTAGHFTGDKLLFQIGKRIQKEIRDGDTFARFGGDEFVILIPYLNEPSFVNQIIDRVKRCLNNPFVVDNTEYFISVSVGVCIYPDDAQDAETLLHNADLAMFKAKKKSNNA